MYGPNISRVDAEKEEGLLLKKQREHYELIIIHINNKINLLFLREIKIARKDKMNGMIREKREWKGRR